VIKSNAKASTRRRTSGRGREGGEGESDGERGGEEEVRWTGLLAGVKKTREANGRRRGERERQRGRKRVPGLDEKGPNLFSGRPSTPPPAKRLTTVWPSSYNPYYPKRTERPPPPSEERVERPEQKLRGGQSTGEACILSHQALPAFSVLLL
jgi:hypothetical protein